MKIKNTSLAYVFFDCIKSKGEKYVLDVISFFNDLDRILKSDLNVKRFLGNPEENLKKKRLFIEKISNNLSLGKEVSNFLMILFSKKKISSLKKMTGEIKSLRRKEFNLEEIKIISSIPLSPNYKEVLNKSFEKKMETNINIEFSVEEELIGGIVVHIDEKIFDASLKRKFEMLSSCLIK